MGNSTKSTRRKFLKGMVAGGAALSVTSLLKSGQAIAEENMPGQWTSETDVVVIGYGAGGTAATLEARAAGAEVIVIERMESGGGAIQNSGGIIYMGGGTPLQKALGFEDTRDNMYNYLMAAVGDGANPEIIGLYCDKSLELYDFLVSNGVKFKQSFIAGKHVVPHTDDGLVYSGNEEQEPYRSIATPIPRGHHAESPGFSGHAIIRPLQKVANASGATFIYQAMAEQLIVNAQGRVVGVAINVKGERQLIKARRAVVMTTGGFGTNKEMIAQHCPAYLRCGVFIGSAGDDGSGIKMGQSVGVDVRLMGESIAYLPVYYPHESLVKGILVNNRGQRYAGEDQYGDPVGCLTTRNYPDSWVIVDQTIMDELPKEAQEKLKISAQASSVTELAKAIKIPEVLLENSLAEYNSMCDSGEDLHFKKNSKYLSGIKVAPFYALNYSANGIWYIPKGGLKINTKAQALDPQGKPVAGLYCAGTVCSQVVAQHYPGSGTLNGQALTFGRIAGQNAAAEQAVS